MRKLWALVWRWFIQLVDVGGKVIGIVDLRKTNSRGSMFILIIGIAIHIEQLAVFPFEGGMYDDQGLIVLRIRARVGDVINEVRIRAGRLGKYRG